MTINARYLAALSKNPLLVKMATSGVLSSLNEISASIFSGQFQNKKLRLFGKEKTVSHPFSSKIGLMVIYGALMSTPVAHYYYGLLSKVFGGKQTSRVKLLQLVTTLCTLSPFLSGLYVSWLSIINSYQCSSEGLRTNLSRLVSVIKAGLKNNFWLVYRTSAITMLIALALAQNFVPPELWVVFTNFIFFVVGTVQNTKIKIRQRNERLKKSE
ncbi:hypothetical protein METBIDRAFT_77170 [Metschnikowia bicuspidata var. bicuspidata NRRL YB-4993]|uniref:Uncharacterized protein n=1 Tax=Metschnikowia bicuspidata var. bicuspidata NRRL YB-4993 TaxID=869754 RepID=A0A1A0HJM5_9ASCO|nr:hypothetical protein METBIDRAFT_77170 [Metschnikowia bicuspidata var. bicuspidata NRRL YB-4993]OBA24369.1 hypothetical protein METBIDRAFT_77170 [Metschnikowia bicuspidata var. bicuspidata NRRL YB-4993]